MIEPSLCTSKPTSARRENVADAPLLRPSRLRICERMDTAALSPCSMPALLLAASYLVCFSTSLFRSL